MRHSLILSNIRHIITTYPCDAGGKPVADRPEPPPDGGWLASWQVRGQATSHAVPPPSGRFFPTEVAAHEAAEQDVRARRHRP
jgi:hypothetical protein